MKQLLFSAAVLVALSPAGSAQDAKLTVDRAKELLPAAAGISNADFEALSENPRPDVVKSKSLSLVLLTLRPTKTPDAAKDKEFRFLGDTINPSDIARAMWRSKDEGYASFIQPKYITDCTCESTAERAEGIVTFKHDLFTGRIPFVAQATKDGWIITEFRLPQYKTKVVRDKDGVWSQEDLKGPDDKERESRQGRDEAGKDIAGGTPKYKRYGQPDASDKLLGQILKADYGITLDIVAGCKVPDDVRQRADGYNEAVLAHMTKKGQKDFLAAAEKKARDQWDRLTPEERARLLASVPHVERTVSLAADRMPLRDALKTIAADADLGIEFDADALTKAGLDLNRPVSAKFENVPLARAIRYLIDWNANPTLLREVRRGKLVFTTLEAWQARTAAKLPGWMKPLYNKGLLATLDDDDEVATVTAGLVVTDELFAKFKTLPRLRELHIEATKGITADGLAHLGKMPRLEKLSLYQINSDGKGLGDDAIRSVAGLESLRELWIGECGTTDAGVKQLHELPNLTALTLRQEVRLTDAALKSIGRLSRLKSLSLLSYVGTRLGWIRFSVDGNRQVKELVDDGTGGVWMRFSADGIRQLKGLKELESLHLIGHDVPADALAFPKLKSLAIGYPGPDDPRERGRDGIGDDVAKKVGDLRDLRELELGYSAVGDTGLKSIAGLPELRRLTLRSTILTDAGIDHFRHHKRLEHVTLRVLGATDKGLRHLAQIETLARLDLDGSGPRGAAPGRQFSMAGLQQLKYLPLLDTLWLTNIDIPGGGFDGLKELRHLRELTLRKTNITEAERDALAKALPNTRLSAVTGGGNFYPPVPKRDR